MFVTILVTLTLFPGLHFYLIWLLHITFITTYYTLIFFRVSPLFGCVDIQPFGIFPSNNPDIDFLGANFNVDITSKNAVQIQPNNNNYIYIRGQSPVATEGINPPLHPINKFYVLILLLIGYVELYYASCAIISDPALWEGNQVYDDTGSTQVLSTFNDQE